jgi:hypothetical protein
VTEQKKKRAPGAGVKADDGAVTERKQVRLDALSETVLLEVGGGNLSLGIREAARRLLENKDTKEFSAKRHALRQQKS